MTSAAQRAQLGRLMDLLVEHEPAVHYARVRPMRTSTIKTATQLRHQLASGVTMDCSESVTLLCRLAGLDDPNGCGYDGSGFTGTMLAHLPHYQRARNAMVGALVVFGPAMGEHVCMVREPGSDPLLFSHGWEGGPRYVRLSLERHAHRAPVTFLSVAKLG